MTGTATTIDRPGGLLSETAWQRRGDGGDGHESAEERWASGGRRRVCRVMRFRFGSGEFWLPDPSPWSIPTLQKICGLGDLPAGWNSYGARPIRPLSAQGALALISVCPASTPAPAVVPTVRGTVQLEWHEQGLNLEIEALSATRFLVAFEDQQTGESLEECVSGDFDRLAAWCARLNPDQR